MIPRSSLSSPCSLSVVQHTSTSTEFANNTWRYVAVYSGVTVVIPRADWDNIPTEQDQTMGTPSETHLTISVPREERGTGG